MSGSEPILADSTLQLVAVLVLVILSIVAAVAEKLGKKNRDNRAAGKPSGRPTAAPRPQPDGSHQEGRMSAYGQGQPSPQRTAQPVRPQQAMPAGPRTAAPVSGAEMPARVAQAVRRRQPQQPPPFRPLAERSNVVHATVAPDDLVAAGRQVARSAVPRPVAALKLADAERLRQVVLYREILGPPKALHSGRESWEL